MRLLLIRHGETVDNVAGVYAGITDSALTNHGVLQASRLGAHLSATGFKVAHLFSSDLQRAFRTAEAIRRAQSPIPPETTKLALLREQDFGSYEGTRTGDKPRSVTNGEKETITETRSNDPDFKDSETKESMRLRSETFVDDYLMNLMHDVDYGHTVVIVAHGIILNHLWRSILKIFHPSKVSVEPDVLAAAERGFSLEYLGMWSNTGYLDLEINRDFETRSEGLEAFKKDTSSLPKIANINTITLASDTAPKSGDLPVELPTNKRTGKLPGFSIVVKAVNNLDHLKGLKKTRGGIGSLKHDSTQKTMDSFFKKRRLE